MNKEAKHMQKFNLLYWDFPKELHNHIGGWTIKQDERLTVLIDSLLPAEKQRFYLKHEIAHIALNHLNQPIPTGSEIVGGSWFISDLWEKEADTYAELMTDEELAYFMEYASSIRKIDTAHMIN